MKRLQSKSMVLTCEHATSFVPPSWSKRLAFSERFRRSHRGFDRGARDLFKSLQAEYSCFSIEGGVSRLLVDLNRDLKSDSLFLRNWDPSDQQKIIQEFYTPYFSNLEKQIESRVARSEKVFHLSIHSFTPVLKGERRKTDIGILFHSGRADESQVARVWQKILKKIFPNLRIDLNKPYQGKAGGIVNVFRGRYSEDQYLAFELEVNQKFCRQNQFPQSLKAGIKLSLDELFKTPL